MLELKLQPEALSEVVNELASYHELFSPLFRRREQREHALQYLHGLLLPLECKSIEPMLLALTGADGNAIRAMQHFIGAGGWDDEAILERSQR